MQPQYDLVVRNTGCAGTVDTLACLRALDISTIQAVNVESPFRGGPSEPLPLWYFLPVVDGTFITGQLYDSFQNGNIVKAPQLVGDDTNEGSDFAYNASTPDEVSAFMLSNYPGLNVTQLELINEVYPLMAPIVLHAAYFPSASAAYGECTFTCPGNHMAAGMATYLSPDQVWNYNWNVRIPEYTDLGLGVPHTTETTAIFGYSYSANQASYAPGGLNAPMVPITMDYFISFVTTLNPNTLKNAAAPTWDGWGTGATGNRLKFQLNATVMEAIPDDLQQRCQFWRSLAPSMEI
jgi:carboxylesterase type B